MYIFGDLHQAGLEMTRLHMIRSERVHRVCIHVHGSTPAAEPMSTLKGHLVSRRRPGAIQSAQYNLINSPKGLLLICAALGEMKCSGLRAALSCRTAKQKGKNKIHGCEVSVLHH